MILEEVNGNYLKEIIMSWKNLLSKPNNNFYLFCCLSAVYLLLTWVTNTIIFTDSTYVSLWSERLTADRAMQLLESNKKVKWIAYLFIPLFLYLKMVLVASTLKSGFYMIGVEARFTEVFRVVLVAEVIPLLALFIQFVYFLLNGIQSMDQLNSFAPFSLLSMLDKDKVPNYLLYPLRMVSLYEIAYWVLLAIGLRTSLQKPLTKSLAFVASSYGLALLLWATFIVFIQVHVN